MWKAYYTVEGVTAVVEEACAALNSEGRNWTVSVSPPDGPAFGTPGMPRVSLIDAQGRVGPEVFVEDGYTLWVSFADDDAGMDKEWFGGPRYDATLRDILYSLSARTFTQDPSHRNVIRIVPPNGGKSFKLRR